MSFYDWAMSHRNRTEAEDRLRRRLRTLRQGANLTLADLAQRAELSADAVAKIEAGERSPRLNTIVALSGALGVQVADLVDESEPDLPPEVNGMVQLVKNQPEAVRSALLEIVRLFIQTPRRDAGDDVSLGLGLSNLSN